MRTLETLSPEHYKKASDDSTFGQIWEDHWGKGLVMDGNLLSVNANLLKRGDRIVVLNEYVDTVKKIEADMRTGSLGCLVVGTPGIGKSTFLPYLLLLLISRGQSVVYFKRECNIFTSDGVFIPRNNSVLMKPLFHGIPALVDADSAQGLELFSDGTMKVYTVLVSSPKEDRIKNYQKEREAAVFVPKAPSRDEAFAVWNLNFSDRVPELQKDLELAWKFYGPDFRIGFELLNSHKTLEEYHTMMKKLISALPKADLKKPIPRPPLSQVSFIVYALVLSCG
ncbi:hypothetical protein GYMLUDRAFT_341988 [Collybiopsis luxurians FD-317 M1]|nr:hypothetical protein GYMLUDRAFT_341988 [Collybiopsis luxurians FD-317 M1]